MNKEKIYTFNKYVLGYDKGNDDRSCLIISKIQNGNMYVMSSLYDSSADVISMMLDNLQQELNKKNKIIEEIKEYCKDYDNFVMPDLYSQDVVDEIQKDLLKIIKKGSEE